VLAGAEDEGAAVLAGAEAEGSWDWKRLLADAVKGVQRARLETIINLTLQAQLQTAEIRHRAAEQKLKEAESQAKEARLLAESQAREATLQAQIEIDRAKLEAEVQAETWADKVRSVVLFFVVLAVVVTPIYAMIRNVLPTRFLQYVDLLLRSLTLFSVLVRAARPRPKKESAPKRVVLYRKMYGLDATENTYEVIKEYHPLPGTAWLARLRGWSINKPS
jgi:hypothetical protein